MKIKEHWVVFSPSGEIAGLSKVSEQAGWYDAEDQTSTRRDELRLIGYRCVKCKIEEASE